MFEAEEGEATLKAGSSGSAVSSVANLLPLGI